MPIVSKGSSISWEACSEFVLACGAIHEPYRFCKNVIDTIGTIVPYDEALQDKEMHLSYHAGQELDYVLSGHIRFSYENKHFEDCGPGDTLMYDSGRGHGIIAIGGQDATILSVVISPKEGKIS